MKWEIGNVTVLHSHKPKPRDNDITHNFTVDKKIGIHVLLNLIEVHVCILKIKGFW